MTKITPFDNPPEYDFCQNGAHTGTMRFAELQREGATPPGVIEVVVGYIAADDQHRQLGKAGVGNEPDWVAKKLDSKNGELTLLVDELLKVSRVFQWSQVTISSPDTDHPTGAAVIYLARATDADGKGTHQFFTAAAILADNAGKSVPNGHLVALTCAMNAVSDAAFRWASYVERPRPRSTAPEDPTS